MNVRLLIVDDHPMLRHGISQAVLQQPNLQLVGEASTAAQALSLAANLVPDLIVMDYHLPDLNGIEAARQILRVQPTIKLIIFSSNAAQTLVDEALQTGVCGYVLKSGDVAELISAIDSVMSGRLYVSPGISAGLLENYRKSLHRQAGPPKPLLSEREKQLLRLIADGRRNKEIAAELSISIKTVEANRSRLMKRLDLTNSAEMVRYAIREGISSA